MTIMTEEIEKEYKELLVSGMFWEFFPHFTGDWGQDKIEYIEFYKNRELNQKHINEE